MACTFTVLHFTRVHSQDPVTHRLESILPDMEFEKQSASIVAIGQHSMLCSSLLSLLHMKKHQMMICFVHSVQGVFHALSWHHLHCTPIVLDECIVIHCHALGFGEQLGPQHMRHWFIDASWLCLS